MAAERELQPAAERGAVDRRDDRLRHRVEPVDDVVQERRLARLAELLDVGAGDEGAPGADDDRGADRWVALDRLERFEQADTDRMGERVDRRIVDADDCDIAAADKLDGRLVAHEALSTAVASISTLARSSTRPRTSTSVMVG